MLRSARLLLLLAIIGLLAACAAPVPKIDAAASKLSLVKSIAVIRPPPQKTYTVLNFGHPGMAFGVVGALVASSDQKSKQVQLTAAYKSQGVDVSALLAERVGANLSNAGFRVRIEGAPWVKSESGYSLDFEKLASDADAILVVAQTIVGFVATTAPSDYVPTIAVVATLLGKDKKNPLYRGFHASGWAPKQDGWRISAPSITFSNFEKLMGDTSASAASLNSAANAIAITVAADLRR